MAVATLPARWLAFERQVDMDELKKTCLKTGTI
jgi:hypothetical protein